MPSLAGRVEYVEAPSEMMEEFEWHFKDNDLCAFVNQNYTPASLQRPLDKNDGNTVDDCENSEGKTIAYYTPLDM